MSHYSGSISDEARSQTILDSIERGDPSVVEFLARNGFYGDYTVSIDRTRVEQFPTHVDRQKYHSETGLTGDIESTGTTRVPILHLAVRRRDPVIVKTLLDHGANVNAATEEGETALILACAYGVYEIAEALLERDVIDVDARTRWRKTALHYAAQLGEERLAVALLRRLADPGATDYQFRSPLHLAAEVGHLAVCLALMEFGADPLAKTTKTTEPGVEDKTETDEDRSATALHYAVLMGHEKIFEAMVERIGVEKARRALGDIRAFADPSLVKVSEETMESRRRMSEKLLEKKNPGSLFAMALAGLKDSVTGERTGGCSEDLFLGLGFGKRSTRDIIEDIA